MTYPYCRLYGNMGNMAAEVDDMVTKTAKITVDLGNTELYKAVKILAIERGITLREVVVEALKEWVEKQEDLEDLADAQARLGEPTRPIDEIIKELGESDLLPNNG
ncbi:MAG: hypothetical protein EXR53_00985 [Dehalococcoidia bacterium]|nr:hypothetical protein [Dehalococcoidia bacterium]